MTLKSIEELRGLLKCCGSIDECYSCSINFNDGIADNIEAEIATRFIELPVDRNGETLRIGDEVWFHDDEDGATPHVVRGYGMTNGWDVDVFLNFADEGWCPNAVTAPDVLVHRRPDPLKELLKELASDVRKEWLEKATLSDGVFDAYADRIRELTGGAE